MALVWQPDLASGGGTLKITADIDSDGYLVTADNPSVNGTQNINFKGMEYSENEKGVETVSVLANLIFQNVLGLSVDTLSATYQSTMILEEEQG